MQRTTGAIVGLAVLSLSVGAGLLAADEDGRVEKPPAVERPDRGDVLRALREQRTRLQRRLEQAANEEKQRLLREALERTERFLHRIRAGKPIAVPTEPVVPLNLDRRQAGP